MSANANGIAPVRRRFGASLDYEYAAFAALLAAIWIIGHPYNGIRHDGALYVGQALLHIQPEVFSRDLFFAYGSQDSYSLFSRLYALMAVAFGVGVAAKVLLVTAQVTFVASAALLIARLFPKRVRWFCLASLFAFPAYYGGNLIFSYGEPFLTGRSFAEPLALFAIWLLLGRRPVAALGCALLAGLFHPLIALPAAALGWLILALRTPRWWLLALGALAVPLLAFAGVGPFAALLVSYDSAWWEVIHGRNSFVFPLLWLPANWMQLAFDTAVAALAASASRGVVRRFFVAALIAGLGGVAASIVGADLMHNVLLTGLQLWRTHWLLHFAAMAALPFVAVHAYRRKAGGHAIAALLVAAAFALRFSGGIAALALAMALWIAPHERLKVSRRTEWVVIGLAVAVAAAGLADQVSLLYYNLITLHLANLFAFGLAILAMPLVAIALTSACWFGVRRAPEATLAIALVLFGFALGNWDRRTDWLRYMEESERGAHPFAQWIGPDRQVYWQHQMTASWLMLNRPSYYSLAQGSGALFNRSTALLYDRRQAVVGILDFQATTCQLMNSLTGDSERCDVTMDAARQVCIEGTDLDFLILESKLENLVVAGWSFKSAKRNARTFYLYDCARLRQA